MFGLFRQSDMHPIVRKVESVASFRLSGVEEDALLSLPVRQAQFEGGQDIVSEGGRPTQSFAMLEEVACSYKTAVGGRRQVMAYHIPGDVPDFQSLHLQVLDNSIAAVGPCCVGFISHDAVRVLLREHPRLAEILWRATLVEAAIVRQWMLYISRQNSYVHMAHLFCELLTRLEAVGQATEHVCSLPMTQSDLADALGITLVHVSRVLQDMKVKGLLSLRDRRLIVHNWEELKRIAEFDRAYLNQCGQRA